MAVTYRPRKRAVPYKTRLTGRLISEAKAFSKKARLTENEGFGVTRRTPRHFYATIFFNSAISGSGAVTFGEWVASIS